MSTSDALVIDALTVDELVLCERIASLEADVAIYRELVEVSFDAVARLTRIKQRLERELDDEQEDGRRLREALLLAAGVEDEDPLCVCPS